MTSPRPPGGTLSPIRGSAPARRPEECPMAAVGSSRPEQDTTAVAYNSGPSPTAWTGWVVFASFIMILVGCFQAIEGLVAIFDDGYYHVTENGLVINVDYTVWGWVHMLLGIAIL